MIVRNEEALLERCLSSVKNFVDEMVIIDTGSTDHTVSIAKDAGARVEHLPWPGDFAPARNAALNLVNGDWVLVLDADEIFKSECIPELKSLMKKNDLLLINLLRLEYGSSISPYSSVSRLFRKHPRIFWSQPYHSMVDDSVRDIIKTEPYWVIGECQEPALIHEGYTEKLIKSRNKSKSLRKAMEELISKNPQDPYANAKLGALEIEEGNHQKGIKILKEALKIQSKTNTVERYELLLNLGIGLTNKNPEAAISTYRKALTIPMNFRLTLGARLNLAALLMQKDNLPEAINLMKVATKEAPEVSICWYNLGLMQRKNGNLIEALKSYQHATELNPYHPETHQNFAVAKLLSGDINGARISCEDAISLLLAQNREDDANALMIKFRGIINLKVKLND